MEVITEHIIELFLTVAAFAIAVITQTVRSYFKKKWQIDLGEYLNFSEIEDALISHKKQIIKKYGNKLSDTDIENETVNKALDFIEKQYPKWTKEYGYTTQRLKEYLHNKYNILNDEEVKNEYITK